MKHCKYLEKNTVFLMYLLKYVKYEELHPNLKFSQSSFLERMYNTVEKKLQTRVKYIKIVCNNTFKSRFA